MDDCVYALRCGMNVCKDELFVVFLVIVRIVFVVRVADAGAVVDVVEPTISVGTAMIIAAGVFVVVFVSAVDVISFGLSAAGGGWCCIGFDSGVALDVASVAGFCMFVSAIDVDVDVDVNTLGLNAVGGG